MSDTVKATLATLAAFVLIVVLMMNPAVVVVVFFGLIILAMVLMVVAFLFPIWAMFLEMFENHDRRGK